jgi:hypothetical protein
MTTIKKAAETKAAAAGATITNADGSVTIALAKPLDVDGTKVAALRMREPTVADQENVEQVGQGNAATMELTMIANLCMVTVDNLRGMSLRDYKKVQGVLTGFID